MLEGARMTMGNRYAYTIIFIDNSLISSWWGTRNSSSFHRDLAKSNWEVLA